MFSRPSGLSGGGIPYKGNNPLTPGKSNITIAAHTLLKEALTINGDADLIAANIRSGKNIFGVAGTMKEGVDLLTITGCTKMTIDKKTWASDTKTSTNTSLQRVNHSLGIRPKYVMMFAPSITSTSKKYIVEYIFSVEQNGGYRMTRLSNQGVYSMASSNKDSVTASDFEVYGDAAGYYLKGGTEYTIITLG